MRVINLGSGSRGNSTLIIAGQTKILLDCGFTLTEIKTRLASAGVSVSEISAMVITHEHNDHIRGLKVLEKATGAPIYAHFNLERLLAKSAPIHKIHAFNTQPFMVGEVLVTPFPVSHDSINCQGFTFEHCGQKFAYATDLGFVSGENLAHLIGAKLVMIEANHDRDMLRNGPYPPILKARIESKNGHLSNTQCAEVVTKLALNGTRFFALAHLSEHNNTPELAFGTIANALANANFAVEKEVFVRLTYQDRIGNNFRIGEK